MSGDTSALTNSTVTGNGGRRSSPDGGGIVGIRTALRSPTASSPATRADGQPPARDIFGSVTISNGHNVFGSDVPERGRRPRERRARADLRHDRPRHGRRPAGAGGIVPLANGFNNPALSGADPLGGTPTDQLGAVRPLPGSSLPDIGASRATRRSRPRPAPTTTCSPARPAPTRIAASPATTCARSRRQRQLRGDGGSDVLDGGAGRDLLDGGPGSTSPASAAAAAVTIDLCRTPPGAAARPTR